MCWGLRILHAGKVVKMKHIIARRIFSDLHHNLTREHFDLAGHSPLYIEFGEKAKAEESRPVIQTVINMLIGFRILKGARCNIMVSDRVQKINTIKISKVHFDTESNFNGLFEAIREKGPKHFNEESPIPIKILATRHLESGCVCVWEKVKIKTITGEEWRLMLITVDGKEVSVEDGAEDYADGMMETVCQTVEAAIVTRNVCEMVAQRMGY